MYAGAGNSIALAVWDKELQFTLGHLFPRLKSGELDCWRGDATGLLCTVVLCDQARERMYCE